MDSKWKSSFGRSRTPMGTVPISVIYGYKYPLSPIPVSKTGPPTPPSYRAPSAWPSCLDSSYKSPGSSLDSPYQHQPPQVVPRRKYYQNGTATDTTTTETVQKKTRGCLSYISSLRTKQTTAETVTDYSKPSTTFSSSFNPSSYTYRKPNFVSSRSRTVDPNYSSYSNSNINSYKSLSRAQTVTPSRYSSTYSGYYSRSNVARSQDYRQANHNWYRPSRFTLSSITSSFSRFRSSIQTFKSRYF